MRELIAWLLWCADQGYVHAEDRAILTNWFLEDPTTLHEDDRDDRDGWLSMADEVIAAIRAESDPTDSGANPDDQQRDIGAESDRSLPS